MNQENKIIENLKKCPSFDGCSQNLCPLDLELHLRTGGAGDKCKWMREASMKNIKGKEFISGGKVMLNGLLKCVPNKNLKWLNKVSQERWIELKK